MSKRSTDLRDLPKPLLKEISLRLGQSAALQFAKESSTTMARQQGGSIRSRIVTKLGELQDRFKGPVLDEKGKFVNDKARDAFIKWYLEERKDTISANPGKDYTKWAMVHLADALKHRKEAAAV